MLFHDYSFKKQNLVGVKRHPKTNSPPSEVESFQLRSCFFWFCCSFFFGCFVSFSVIFFFKVTSFCFVSFSVILFSFGVPCFLSFCLLFGVLFLGIRLLEFFFLSMRKAWVQVFLFESFAALQEGPLNFSISKSGLTPKGCCMI